MFNASTLGEIEAAFDAIAKKRPDALLVGTDPFFLNQRTEIIELAKRLSPYQPFIHFATMLRRGV
jgi:hypothetical protein